MGTLEVDAEPRHSDARPTAKPLTLRPPRTLYIGYVRPRRGGHLRRLPTRSGRGTRRDGGGVEGEAARAGPPGRVEGNRAPSRRKLGVPRALPARIAACGIDRPPECDPCL